MQKLIIAGNVGKNAELRRTGNGEPVLGFSLAVDNGKDKNGNKRDTTWVDASIWGKRAEALERHITKGSKLTLIGRPTVREHNGKAYLGISVDDLTFMGGGQSNGGGSRDGGYEGGQESSGYGAGAGPNSVLEDEIPFAPEWR